MGNAPKFDLPVLTYDMDFSPDGGTLTHAFTAAGARVRKFWAANSNGKRARRMHAEQNAVITFACWSPDGRQIVVHQDARHTDPLPGG